MRTLRAVAAPVLALALCLGPRVLHAQAPAGQRMLFAADIQRFLVEDKLSPPPKGGIEFVGSSIFREWATLARDMAPLPVLNRAFGGSRTWEVNASIDQIVLPYQPSIIVYYCGSNDIQAGGDQSAQDVFERVKEFEIRVHGALPSTRIYFFAINRAMDQRDRWDVIDEANALVKQWAYRTPNFDYIESNTVLFDAKDEPIKALYQPDGRHFLAPAYAEFTKLIKPVLLNAWDQSH